MNQKLIILNIVDCPDEYTGQKQLEFTINGGSIGRSSSCTFQMPDDNKYISSTHVLITSYNGCFYINDTSTNGSFVNGQKIEKNQPFALNNGDTVILGRYQLSVSIENKINRTDLAADIMPELSSDDPLKTLDIVLPKESKKQYGQLNELFPELEQPAETSDDPLSYLKLNNVNDEYLIQPETETVEKDNSSYEISSRQLTDDSESVYSQMDVPNLIPEDWINNHEVTPKVEPYHSKVSQIEDDIEQNEPLSDFEPDPVITAPAVYREAHENNDSALANAFFKGLGYDAASEQLTSTDCFEQMGRSLKLCLAAFATDLHEASTLLNKENNDAENVENILNSMFRLYQESQIYPAELVEQIIEEVTKHRSKLQSSAATFAFEQSKQCDPVAFKQNLQKQSMWLPKSKLWHHYTQHYQSHLRALIEQNTPYFDEHLKALYQKNLRNEDA